MLSDLIHDTILDIEHYQRDFPDSYDCCREHIELVKAVMDSLREALDQPPFDFGVWYERLLNTRLTDTQKARWRVWCEAGLARWAERLRLLGPVPAEGLVERVRVAITRQETLLREPADDVIEGSRALFLRCLYVWCFLNDFEPVKQRIAPALTVLGSDTENMPVDACDWLGLPVGSTYAEGVKVVTSEPDRWPQKPAGG